MGQKVKITLTVAAKSLMALGNPSTSEIDRLCLISDDDKGKFVGALELADFISDVYKGYEVKFKGESINDGYKIEITDCVHKPGEAGAMDPHSIEHIGVYPSREVEYDINPGVITVPLDTSYIIHFKITDPTGLSQDFIIDPILRVNP